MAAPKQFLKSADKNAHDQKLKHKLRYNIGKYDAKVLLGKKQYENIELARKIAKRLKWKTISQLDEYLLRFEDRFEKRGGKVIWASDTAEALQAIGEIAKKNQVKSVVKSKSMATEEIELNEFLEKQGIAVAETDLGEYIQQLDGEKPFHIVTPAMHKSKEDVAELFHRKLGTDINLTPTELTLVARRVLREKYTEAEMGITGANFLVADIGGIAITENEGNGRLSIGFPKIHVAIVGIEKIIPSMDDLGHFWPLLSTYGTGQQVTVYNSIVSGPRQEGELDGPEEMYVILLDNGRTDLLAEEEQRQALYCIRCGACLNACPVYKNIGGHAYDTTYSGPIGSVISPHLRGKEDFGHLSYASSLCGNCTDVCPVRIDIHELLLANRRDSIEEGYTDWTEQMTWKAWKAGMLSRTRMNAGGSTGKNFLLRTFFGKQWGTRRELPQLASKSFNQMWKSSKRPVSKPPKKQALPKQKAGNTTTHTVRPN